MCVIYYEVIIILLTKDAHTQRKTFRVTVMAYRD